MTQVLNSNSSSMSATHSKRAPIKQSNSTRRQERVHSNLSSLAQQHGVDGTRQVTKPAPREPSPLFLPDGSLELQDKRHGPLKAEKTPTIENSACNPGRDCAVGASSGKESETGGILQGRWPCLHLGGGKKERGIECSLLPF